MTPHTMNPLAPTAMRLDPEWGKSWRTLVGEAVALDFDTRGLLWILHRPGFLWEDLHLAKPLAEPAVIVVQPETGDVLSRWGAHLFACPHGLKWDPEGNLWIVDTGLHQVFKFSRTFDLLLTLGERGQPGDADDRLNFPTDVAFLPGGQVAVSDGYGNNRVLLFDAAGRLLGTFGEKGDSPGQFKLPHALTVDRENRLLVVDRGNARIQRFDANGRFIDIWQNDALGHPWALRHAKNGWFYGVDAGDTLVQEERAGAFLLDEGGNVLLRWGQYGREPGAFVWPHDIAVSHRGDVYIAEAKNQRVQRFVPAYGDTLPSTPLQ